jgi:hypothetical protein
VKQESINVECPFSPEESMRHMTTAGEIAKKVKAGLISENEALQELLAMGTNEFSAKNFLLHALRQEELDGVKEKTGVVVD